MLRELVLGVLMFSVSVRSLTCEDADKTVFGVSKASFFEKGQDHTHTDALIKNNGDYSLWRYFTSAIGNKITIDMAVNKAAISALMGEADDKGRFILNFEKCYKDSNYAYSRTRKIRNVLRKGIDENLIARIKNLPDFRKFEMLSDMASAVMIAHRAGYALCNFDFESFAEVEHGEFDQDTKNRVGPKMYARLVTFENAIPISEKCPNSNSSPFPDFTVGADKSVERFNQAADLFALALTAVQVFFPDAPLAAARSSLRPKNVAPLHAAINEAITDKLKDIKKKGEERFKVAYNDLQDLLLTMTNFELDKSPYEETVVLKLLEMVALIKPIIQEGKKPDVSSMKKLIPKFISGIISQSLPDNKFTYSSSYVYKKGAGVTKPTIFEGLSAKQLVEVLHNLRLGEITGFTINRMIV